MLDFVVVVLDGALAVSVGATLDLLRVARVTALGQDREPLNFRVVGHRSPVRLSGGLLLEVDTPRTGAITGRPTFVVPGIGLELPRVLAIRGDDGAGHAGHAGHAGVEGGGDRGIACDGDIDARLAREDARALSSMLAAHHREGCQVAASCSGALLLAAAGLLDGRRCTAHWSVASYIERRHPDAKIHRRRTVVEDGGVITAGLVLAQIDLMLYLLRQKQGRAISEPVVRYLLDNEAASTICSRVSEAGSALDDEEIVRRFDALVEASLPGSISIAVVAVQMELGEKTLTRRILRASGQTPHARVQEIRLRHAQRLLAIDGMSVEEVAHRSGYSSSASLRKLMARMANASPTQFRKGLKPPVI